jgi:methylmalonyl-CoA mutase
VTKPTALDTSPLDLAADFPAVDPQAWMALVEKSLGGRSYEKLTSKSYDGIDIKPLYTQSDPAADATLPGMSPYTRGASFLGTATTGWDIRCLSSHPDPAEANRQILEDLQKGATSIWLKLDPTGKTGTVIKSRADLETLLDGVFLDLVPIVLDPGGPSLPPAAYLMELLSRKGVDASSFSGNFGADPLSTLATAGKVIVPMDTLFGRMADLMAYVAKTYPNAKSLNISTATYHNAGCSEAQELAIAMATAVEYLRHLSKTGLAIDDACRQVAFTLTCDTDIFLTMAKLRAARQLWARIAEVCGASELGKMAPFYAVTAPRMMSQRDPWVNMLRTTAACFGAGAGGAEAVTILPFEHAVGLPTALGRRIARNTQIILQEESSINKVVDPVGGSWMVESLTQELAETAWSIFQGIEKDGGMAATLRDGTIAAQIAETELLRAKNISTRKDSFTGVSEYPNLSESPVEIETPDVAKIVSAADARAAGAVGKAKNFPGHSNGALMVALVQAAVDDTSVASIGAALKGTPTKITPLPQHRLTEDYEALRDASDRHLESYGARPKVFLANIGKVAEFTARSSFSQNLFEAGGVEAVSGAGGDTPIAIADNFKSSGADIAIICSTDALYADHAEALATDLKAAGASRVYLAGRGGERESAWRASGLDGFVYMGCDVLSILKEVHQSLGLET